MKEFKVITSRSEIQLDMINSIMQIWGSGMIIMKGLSSRPFTYLKFKAIWDGVDISTYLELRNPVNIFPVNMVCN